MVLIIMVPNAWRSKGTLTLVQLKKVKKDKDDGFERTVTQAA